MIKMVQITSQYQNGTLVLHGLDVNGQVYSYNTHGGNGWKKLPMDIVR